MKYIFDKKLDDMTMYTPFIIKFVKVAKLWQFCICGVNFRDFERISLIKCIFNKNINTWMTWQSIHHSLS